MMFITLVTDTVKLCQWLTTDLAVTSLCIADKEIHDSQIGQTIKSVTVSPMMIFMMHLTQDIVSEVLDKALRLNLGL